MEENKTRRYILYFVVNVLAILALETGIQYGRAWLFPNGQNAATKMPALTQKTSAAEVYDGMKVIDAFKVPGFECTIGPSAHHWHIDYAYGDKQFDVEGTNWDDQSGFSPAGIEKVNQYTDALLDDEDAPAPVLTADDFNDGAVLKGE